MSAILTWKNAPTILTISTVANCLKKPEPAKNNTKTTSFNCQSVELSQGVFDS